MKLYLPMVNLGDKIIVLKGATTLEDAMSVANEYKKRNSEGRVFVIRADIVWQEGEEPVYEEKTVTLSMEKLKLLAQYYDVPITAFFATETEIRDWISKYGTKINEMDLKTNREIKRKLEAYEKIKNIIQEV